MQNRCTVLGALRFLWDARAVGRPTEARRSAMRKKGAEGSISQWKRVVWLDGELREGRYPNIRALEEKFEVSRFAYLVSVRRAHRQLKYLTV